MVFRALSLNIKNTSTSLINFSSRRWGRRYRRWYCWPNDFLPFHWERTKTDPPYLNTGDSIRDIGIWNPTELVPGAEHSQVIKNAPEIVRRQFSLGFAERRTIVQYQLNKITDLVKQYKYDKTSLEYKIAEYTIHIRNNLFHFTKVDKYDAPRKIGQEQLKNRRSKALSELYYLNRESYNNIVKILGITHQVPELGSKPTKATRKSELRRLTREYCDRIKKEKLEQYHQELLSKQPELDCQLEHINALIKKDKKYVDI